MCCYLFVVVCLLFVVFMFLNMVPSLFQKLRKEIEN